MKTTITEDENLITVKLIGRLDTASTAQCREEMAPVFESKKDVLIDCSELEFISSSGLRIILSIRKATKANNVNLTLSNMNEDVSNVFRITGFAKTFVIQ